MDNPTPDNEKLPEDFINVLKFKGSPIEYLKVAKEKKLLDFLDYELLEIGWRNKILTTDDITEKVLKAHPLSFCDFFK